MVIKKKVDFLLTNNLEAGDRKGGDGDLPETRS